MGQFSREEILFGKEKVNKLKNSKVLVFGYGNVGKGGSGPKGVQPKGGKESGEKKDPKEGKSPFFLHHYPDGDIGD